MKEDTLVPGQENNWYSRSTTRMDAGAWFVGSAFRTMTVAMRVTCKGEQIRWLDSKNYFALIHICTISVFNSNQNQVQYLALFFTKWNFTEVDEMTSHFFMLGGRRYESEEQRWQIFSSEWLLFLKKMYFPGGLVDIVFSQTLLLKQSHLVELNIH